MELPSSFSDGVQGWFDEHGRPRIRALVKLPRLNAYGNIRFVVDTGADVTMISYHDADLLGIKPNQLRRPTDTHGIGGSIRCFKERSFLHFEEAAGKIHAYRVEAQIASPDQTPPVSLLGRDVMRRWVLLHHQLAGIVQAVVLEADKTVSPAPTAAVASLS